MTAEHAHGIDAGGEVACDCAGRLIETNAHERHCAIYGPHDPAEQLAEALERGVPSGPAAIHFCPWPNCLDIWESEASCVHAQAIQYRDAATRNTAADAVLAEARRLCCGENPSAHHAATDKHSELMAFAGRLAGAVRGS